jgi:hypothetical protein
MAVLALSWGMAMDALDPAAYGMTAAGLGPARPWRSP